MENVCNRATPDPTHIAYRAVAYPHQANGQIIYSLLTIYLSILDVGISTIGHDTTVPSREAGQLRRDGQCVCLNT